MLDLDRCRKLLGEDAAVTDEELVEIRESLYQLAHLLVTAYAEQDDAVKAVAASEEFQKFLETLSPEKQDQLEIRATALCNDIGVTRDDAERMAITEYIETQRN